MAFLEVDLLTLEESRRNLRALEAEMDALADDRPENETPGQPADLSWLAQAHQCESGEQLCDRCLRELAGVLGLEMTFRIV